MLAAAVITENLDRFASSHLPASSPSFHSTVPQNNPDDLHLTAPLVSYPTSPGASSLAASGSPGRQRPPRQPNSTRSSSPENRKPESSYYTTAWGSPYAVDSPRRLSWSHSEYASFDPDSRSSSPDSTRSNFSRRAETDNDFLRPYVPRKSSARHSQSRGTSRSPRHDLGSKRGGKTIKEFTKDWINQFLSGQPRTERSNWLSDDSGSDSQSFLASENYFDEDPSDGWLGLEGSSRNEDLLRTPKSSDFIGRSKRSGLGEKRAGLRRAKHERTDTIRQEDIWGFAYDRDSQFFKMSEVNNGRPDGEKPLPPVPQEPSASSTGSSNPKAENPATEPLPPRPKKKMVWRGKACIIALPRDDKRGSEASGYRLLTAEDVERRLKEWEDEGFDIRGFSVGAPEDPTVVGDLGGLSRPPYPDPAESQEEWKAGRYGVSFPNRAEWDAYVNYLQEEKLRALGVSLGDEDEQLPSVSPVSAAVSQVAPPFPGLIASPPIPTASAGSNPLGVANPFSPVFSQSANVSTGIASLASPVSQLSVQSPFFGVDQNVLGGYPIQFQPTPPAQGPLTPQLFNARQGVISTLPGNLPNLTSILPPVSPLNNGVFQSIPPKDSMDGRFVHDFQGEDSDMRSPPPNFNQAEIHTPPGNFRVSNVEIAHPTPRGHDHNLSETLQKGLDEAEQPDYHLEESIERQLDEEEHNHFGRSGLSGSRWAVSGDHPIQNNFQQNDPSFSSHPSHDYYNGNYGEDYGQEGSDFDTNPSLAGTPQRQQQPLPWHQAKPSTGSFGSGHQTHHSVTSTFNVEAKEFAPVSVPFQGNVFQPSGPGKPVFTFNSGPTFDPAAAPKHAAAFSDQNKAHPGGYKFSTVNFNADAPVFNPNASVNSTGAVEGPANCGNKIFGDIDWAQITKPAKKSKAIPIVRPDDNEHESKQKEADRDNNGSSRSAPTDRHKRVRRSNEENDMDKDVKLDRPVHALTETSNVPVVPSSNNMPHSPADGKENKAPGGDNKRAAEGPSSGVDEKQIERIGTPASEATTWISEGYKNEKEGAAVNAAAADSSGQHGEQSENPESAATNKDKPSKPATQESKDAAKSPVSSPSARPFEFKPAVPEFIPPAAEPPSVTAEASVHEQIPTSIKDEPKVETKVPTSPTVAPPSDDNTGEESLDERELNAIMDQLNGDSDIGVERQESPCFMDNVAESIESRSAGQYLVPDNRSNAPSPSPRRFQDPRMVTIPKFGSYFDPRAPVSLSPQRTLANGIHSSVQHLINENDHISDWGDMISSSEDEKFAVKSQFFGRRVNDLDGGALEERLISLERTLGIIQQSMASMISKSANRRAYRGFSPDFDSSDADADDEDEGEEGDSTFPRTRATFDKRDRRFDKLRSIVMEAMATYAPREEAELAQLRESISGLKELTLHKLAQDPTANLKEMMQEVVANQLDLRKSEAEEVGAESLMLQIDGLKTMLRLADERADEEYNRRRESQEVVAELKRLLKLAEEEATRHSEAAEAAETRLLQFKEEKIPYFEKLQFQADSLTNERETLQLTLAELSSKNIVLEGTLDEYRVSSENYKRESETMKQQNKDLLKSIEHLKIRIDDSLNGRQNLREKFDRLQNDMATVVRDVARDQAAWRKREEEQIARYDGLRATYEREVRLREKLEYDVNELEKQEREATKLKFIFGQSQQENERLEELVANLRLENHELEIKAARFEREFNEARESSRMEIQRTRTSFESDLEAANSQVNIVRAELEAEIARLQTQLDNVKLDADTSRERYEMLLEEANESKANDLAAAAETRTIELREQSNLHERILRDLQEEHARAIRNVTEDHQRSETLLAERLALSDEKVVHLQDRVHHLEDKLEIANTAARAAAQAAKEAKAGIASSSPVLESTSPSMPYRKDSMVPDKISPQALRESILVLQDQLQHRETRIEELEQELAAVDKEAPNKLREKNTEITWLRELLGVRIDDLQDIINTISKPSFDPNAVRDAAIRLRANLQMQQQEKERSLFGGPSLPSISSIASLTASPRSLPLAAAAAWGNWRKARGRTDSNQSDQTPSKPSNTASAFLSGLLTPPGSNIRQLSRTKNNGNDDATASGSSTTELQPPYSEGRRPLKAYAPTPMRPLSPLRARQTNSSIDESNGSPSALEPPTTPPLLRKSSYDHDANPTSYDDGIFGEDSLTCCQGGNTVFDDELTAMSPKGTVDDDGLDHRESEPFEPQAS